MLFFFCFFQWKFNIYGTHVILQVFCSLFNWKTPKITHIVSQAKPKTEIVPHMSLSDSAIKTLLIHRSLFWSVIWPSVPMERFLGHANQRIWGYFSTFYCFCWFRRPVFWGVDPLREDKWQTEPSKRELLLTLNVHPIFEYTGDERHCIVFYLFVCTA